MALLDGRTVVTDCLRIILLRELHTTKGEREGMLIGVKRTARTDRQYA